MNAVTESNTTEQRNTLGIVAIRFIDDGMDTLGQGETQYGTISNTFCLELYKTTPDGRDIVDGKGVFYYFRLQDPLIRAVELEPGVDVIPGYPEHSLQSFKNSEGGSICFVENPDADILRMPTWLEALICKAIEDQEVAA